MYNDLLISHLHKLYRADPYIHELYDSVGIEMDNIESIINDLEKEFYFDTMTESVGIPLFENLLSFKTDPIESVEDKSSQLEARYKSNGKCDLDLIRAVCNSWKNGDIQVQLIDGDISIKFVGEYGIPKDLENLKKAIGVIKPAQLILVYSFRYLLIGEVDGVMTLDQLQQQTLDRFAF